MNTYHVFSAASMGGRNLKIRTPGSIGNLAGLVEIDV